MLSFMWSTIKYFNFIFKVLLVWLIWGGGAGRMRLKSRYVLVLSKIYSKQIELCHIAGILPWPYCKNFLCHIVGLQ